MMDVLDPQDIMLDCKFFRAMVIQELTNYAFADVTDYVDFSNDCKGNTEIPLKPYSPLHNYATIEERGEIFSVKFPNRMKALKALWDILSKEEAECRDIEREKTVREMNLSVQMLVLSNKKDATSRKKVEMRSIA